MSVIQTKSFVFPSIIRDKDSIAQIVAEADVEVNNFISPIIPQNVLEIKASWFSLGKYGELSVYQVTVIYLA